MWGIKVRIAQDDWVWVLLDGEPVLFKTEDEAIEYVEHVGWKLYKILIYEEN